MYCDDALLSRSTQQVLIDSLKQENDKFHDGDQLLFFDKIVCYIIFIAIIISGDELVMGRGAPNS